MSPRHTDLTPGIQDAICRLVRDGMYPGPAGEAVGISDSSVNRWLADGAGQAGMEDSPYRVFREAVKRAEAEWEAEMIALVSSSARESKNWLAAMTALQRRHPDRWGVRDGDRPGSPINITFNVRYTPRLESEGAFTVLPDVDTVKQLPEAAPLDTVNTPVEDLPF